MISNKNIVITLAVVFFVVTALSVFVSLQAGSDEVFYDDVDAGCPG